MVVICVGDFSGVLCSSVAMCRGVAHNCIVQCISLLFVGHYALIP